MELNRAGNLIVVSCIAGKFGTLVNSTALKHDGTYLDQNVATTVCLTLHRQKTDNNALLRKAEQAVSGLGTCSYCYIVIKVELQFRTMCTH